MAKFTSGFGVLVLVVGVMGYVMTSAPQTIGFGIVMIVCGVLANSENRVRRMIWMHVAVVIAAVAFLLPAWDATHTLHAWYKWHRPITWPQMLRFEEVVAVLSLVFVVVGLASFVLARRPRAIAGAVQA